MRTLRTQLLTIYGIIGIATLFFSLAIITGFMLGAVTPHLVTAWLAASATRISASPLTSWLGLLIGWAIAIWTTSIIWQWRAHKPVVISEDESGAVEIAPEALCSLARNELRQHGLTKNCDVEFTRKLGSPVLQVWCDLARGTTGESPVSMGGTLKTGIEKRLRNDFDLREVHVSIIHRPSGNGVRKKKAASAA
jgi:hypothetical protein